MSDSPMNNSNALAPPVAAEPPTPLRLGGLPAATPGEITAVASKVASELSRIIEERKLYSNIQGRRYVKVEGWTTCAALLGVVAREVSVVEKDGDFEAVVELVRAFDGMVIGRGSAICGTDEPTWSKRPRYARRSMAVTRATGKANRLAFSWIVALAGFEPTPVEEMPDDRDDPPRRVENSAPTTPKTTRTAEKIERRNGQVIDRTEAQPPPPGEPQSFEAPEGDPDKDPFEDGNVWREAIGAEFQRRKWAPSKCLPLVKAFLAKAGYAQPKDAPVAWRRTFYEQLREHAGSLAALEAKAKAQEQPSQLAEQEIP